MNLRATENYSIAIKTHVSWLQRGKDRIRYKSKLHTGAKSSHLYSAECKVCNAISKRGTLKSTTKWSKEHDKRYFNL
jgi:hypothetical protein